MSRESRDELYRSLELEVRAQQNAVERIDAAACELMGVNRTDGRCLDIIDQHRRITAGDLAKAVALSTGAVTAVLDRLEAAGHIRRVRDDLDRRRVYVEVSPETQQRMHELYAPLALERERRLATYTIEELLLLRAWLESAKEIATEHAERLEVVLDNTHAREGTVERVRRTAYQTKRDMKAAVGDLKYVAKEEKRRVKQQAKSVKTELKTALKGELKSELKRAIRDLDRPDGPGSG